jgi:tRNA pseudouridine synthase 8/2,5-diamino-6-(5-phospho-D-ribitylamino)-pyrimidin-4(3H)-one deaminase
MITHTAIRKEPPVYNLPIDIIYEDDQLLVVNKPSSIPVQYYIIDTV